MSDWVLIVLVAALTYTSRATAVALLPPAEGRILQFVDRLPVPLFAGLAIFSLVGDASAVPEPPAIAAALGALLVAARRSLGLTLIAGLAAYALADLVV